MHDNLDESKEFEPTEKKLRDARKKGDVAKIADLSSAVSLALICLVFLTFYFFSSEILTVNLSLFWRDDVWRESNSFEVIRSSVLWRVIWPILVLLFLIFLCGAAGAVVPSLINQSLVFSTARVSLKVSNISIISGLKNKLGAQGLFEFLKSSVKLVCFFLVGVFFTFSNFEDLFLLFSLGLDSAILKVIIFSLSFMVTCVFVSLLIGGSDAFCQRQFHLRKLRMSRKEMQDEFKEAEGDPALKAKRQQFAAERSRQGGLSDVSSADVVLVNPTHYAVALVWDRSGASVPIVVAKGVDEVAKRIRTLAQENGVPVRRDPVTARSVYTLCEIGEPIHVVHFKAVAAAIRFADALRAKSAV